MLTGRLLAAARRRVGAGAAAVAHARCLNSNAQLPNRSTDIQQLQRARHAALELYKAEPMVRRRRPPRDGLDVGMAAHSV
jgi:hypothetical protein